MAKTPPTSAKPSLQDHIKGQEAWTFSECVGLADDYNMKVRMVIATVYAAGKTYVERDLKAPEPKN